MARTRWGSAVGLGLGFVSAAGGAASLLLGLGLVRGVKSLL